MAVYQLLPGGGGGGTPRPGIPRRLLLLLPLVVLVLLWTTRTRTQDAEVQQEQEKIVLTTMDMPPEPSSIIEVESPASTAPPELAIPVFIPFAEPLPCNRLTTTVFEEQTWLSPSPSLPTDASLSSRLSSLLDAPAGSHGNWTRFNNQTCGNPSVLRSVNVVHERNSKETWGELSEDRVRELRESMAEVLRKAEKEGRLEASAAKKKRGIVFTAGNADTVSRVIVSLRLLRSYGSTLPAEVFHFASETPANEHIDTLKSLNAVVRIVDGVDKAESQSRTKSFHIKGAALVQSSYDELLYLDSDSILVSNPESLFETKGFKELGAMFWSDYWKDSADNAIWRILGVQCRDEWTMESGQILIDKRRHLDTLLIVEHMLQDWPFWFKISDGDKDLFRYAFLALRKRWAVPGRTIASASWTNEAELGDAKKGEFCGHTMLQSDDRGQPMFVHANLLKRIAGTFYSGGTWGRTRQLSLPQLPLVSAFSPTSAAEFATSADHLANANAFGIALLPAPPRIRKRAALERGLNTYFHQGHRGSAYVLCVETKWDDPRWMDEELAGAEKLEVDLSEKELEVPREEQCGPTSTAGDVGYAEAAMEVVSWEDDPVLKGFEAAFYKAGGKANGHGFR